MIRRKLNESEQVGLQLLKENLSNKDWEATNNELYKLYNYLFEDVKSVRQVYVPHNLTGVGFELFEEVNFKDEKAYFINTSYRDKIDLKQIDLSNVGEDNIYEI